jgi:hypothetical protein
MKVIIAANPKFFQLCFVHQPEGTTVESGEKRDVVPAVVLGHSRSLPNKKGTTRNMPVAVAPATT